VTELGGLYTKEQATRQINLFIMALFAIGLLLCAFAIVKVLLANADKARSLINKVAPSLQADSGATSCACRKALEHALITAPVSRDPALVQRLAAVAGRKLRSS